MKFHVEQPRSGRLPASTSLFLALVATAITGCASAPTLDDEAALRARAEAYWAARVANDHVEAYRFEVVSTQADASLQRYLAGRGPVSLHSAEVTEVRILDDGEGEVSVRMSYRLPLPGMRDPITGDALSHWRSIEGQWYHSPRPGAMWQR